VSDDDQACQKIRTGQNVQEHIPLTLPPMPMTMLLTDSKTRSMSTKYVVKYWSCCDNDDRNKSVEQETTDEQRPVEWGIDCGRGQYHSHAGQQ